MTSQHLVKTSSVLLFALGCCSSVRGEQTEHFFSGSGNLPSYNLVKVFPFYSRSISEFLEFMNKVNWSDGAKRTFYNERNCEFPKDDDLSGIKCRADMKETNAIGERKCANVGISYGPNVLPYIYNKQGTPESINFFEVDERVCTKWKEVAAEPPKEKTSEPSQSTQSIKPANTGDITITRTELLISGLVVFVLGIGFGLFSSIRKY